ncbi:glycosyltransferase [Paenibacillus lactis]|uniref:glycosyltransferase n=1 Tax=Paenibacillus lactis TaxID=228574 RepID=UPI00203C1757|nr:glycosyltransferase [Paenibacillus lactis]MCM3493469.1 glycosyltransferase [Paenibacillus lactis]
MKKQTISLCMIVKNEERCIERCLTSVKDIVDEIIIVDTGSNDNTIEIAKKFTDQIFSIEWNGDFAEARNHALKYATGDYILSLDADEWLDQDSQTKARNIQLNEDYYYVRIRNIIRRGVQESHSYIRLFRNIGLEYTGKIHEQIEYWNFPELKSGEADFYINHDGYKEEVVASQNKSQRNLAIILKEIEEKPSAFGYFNLGTQYKLMGELEKAIEAYKKSFSMGSDYVFTHKLIIYLVQCLLEQKRYVESLDILNDVILMYPLYTDYHFYRGLTYMQLNYYKDAEKSFLKCISLGEVTHFEWTSMHGVGSFISYTSLAELQFCMGNFNSALQYIDKAITLNHVYEPAIKIFLDIISLESVEQQFELVRQRWDFKNSEEVKVLLAVIYKVRSPLIKLFFRTFDIKVTDEEVEVYLLLIGEEYEKAKLKIKSFKTNQWRDIVYLSFITSDEHFISKLELNFDKTDYSLFRKLIVKEQISEDSEVGQFPLWLKALTEDLIINRQFNQLELLTKLCTTSLGRLQIAEALLKYGYYEVALEILIEPTQKDIVARDIYMVAGQALSRLGNHVDSLFYYSLADEIMSDYKSLFNCYSEAVQVRDHVATKSAVQKLLKLVPLSNWALEESRKILN